MLKNPREAWAEAWGAYHVQNESLPEYIAEYIEQATEKPIVKESGSDIIKMNLQVFAGNGKERAQKYSKNWSGQSLKDAVSRFIGENAVRTETQSGKIIFSNPNGTYNVVYDKDGNYFRIEDTTKKGKRRYTDMQGNDVSNITENGRTRGRTKEEYEAITHFNNIDEVQE